MGGIYGNCAATALEDAPPEARGILSGMLQQGYAFGYLLAAVFARALAHDPTHGWRPLFWFGACPPAFFILWRLFLPETNAFIARQELRKHAELDGLGSTFLKEAKEGFKKHWLTLGYMVLLMAGFNFMVRTLLSSPKYEKKPQKRNGAEADRPPRSPTAPKTCTRHCSRASSSSRATA
jgi:SHS family lactate transporter-like MFS transporter